MHPIRWWRVQRAYALLRFGLRVKRDTPRRALVAMTRLVIATTNEDAPAAVLSALDVIKSNGATKPAW